MNLQDKVVAITGGGQGLGRSMAVYLAHKGAQIAIIDLSQEHMDETKRQVEAAGSKACTYLCNVANEEQVEETFDAIIGQMGGLHGLVNNAGILRDGLLVKVKDGEITKMTLAQWQAVIDVNLTGVFLCGREAAIRMIKHGEGGCIINISSISRSGNMGQTNYSAAKAGVATMAVSWAKELARYGIRANAIAPGFIATEMTSSMKPEALEKMTAGIPLKRMGQPEDIANAVAFLLENDYMSGRVVEVDGGLRL
ncbi:MAG: SDR family oxidoreductase [Thalassolituus sp.]|jgi:3-oxoacyl-[acyl-carrier protein] reductase|uniref:3-oxoacyl-[acyl-carrier protein] reductase n=1 Tax=hydrothermal vent metagenome TaxID=652676 RepID=A0A160TDJ4_9ZZZZ|nr:SDR family oxidoreductase [Thalassolituus oleivorans]PCI49813.1 MAG: 3-oxoacyl-ACP reductase [Oceanospirillales bacterium]AHK16601.1 3-ketoacyl-ACP reductase [Thalassolituus oleivorans R6-15]APR68040.1 3-oxoacyl-ACP reductase [Thalassolituus oleivorans]MBQ0727833.1 SDR family oxidoreductase [Thalassolituus oleivorans]MBQ0780416.1 SDR family oxidoreductase [Thalassolituus oleivorans]|tara:strand:- start:8236 stop:8994 length:759 start_codon:yes stop_codon:yes gene_type:complete